MMQITLQSTGGRRLWVPFVCQFDGWDQIEALLSKGEIDRAEAKRAKAEVSRLCGRED